MRYVDYDVSLHNIPTMNSSDCTSYSLNTLTFSTVAPEAALMSMTAAEANNSFMVDECCLDYYVDVDNLIMIMISVR